ncbi:MAG: hypothetical protein O2826_02645 [Chloroflexi bacterium]|nr:hypothetical protein [Chloroflexota bacterium]MDA1173398.1 hypothetical protein [Chloroflexota bacterium]
MFMGDGGWKSRVLDTMHRFGLGPKKKQEVADEMTPGQLRAERERRAREEQARSDDSSDAAS